MLELIGSGYVIEHCMSALRQMQADEAFRDYMADGLYAISHGNIIMQKRFHDMMHPKTEKEKKKEADDNKKEAKRIKNKILDKLRRD